MEYQDKDNILECFGYHKKCLKIIFSLASYHLKHLLFGDYLFNLIEKKSHISRDLLGGVMKNLWELGLQGNPEMAGVATSLWPGG